MPFVNQTALDKREAGKEAAIQQAQRQAQIGMMMRAQRQQQADHDFKFAYGIASDSKFPVDVRTDYMNKILGQMPGNHMVTPDQLEPVLPLFRQMTEAAEKGEPLDQFGPLLSSYMDKGLIGVQQMPQAINELGKIREAQANQQIDNLTQDPELESVRGRHQERLGRISVLNAQLEQLEQGKIPGYSTVEQAFGPGPDQSNMPVEGIPNDAVWQPGMTAPAGGFQTTHPMTGELLAPPQGRQIDLKSPAGQADYQLTRTRLLQERDELTRADQSDAYRLDELKLYDERNAMIKAAVRNDPAMLEKMKQQKLGEMGLVGLDDNGRKTQWTRLAAKPQRSDEEERAFSALSVLQFGKTSAQIRGEQTLAELKGKRSQISGQREIIAGVFEKDKLEQEGASRMAADGASKIPPAPEGNYVNPADFDPTQESTITAIGNLIEPAKQKLMQEAQPVVEGLQEVKGRYLQQAMDLEKRSAMQAGPDRGKTLEEAKRLRLMGDALDAQAVLALDGHPMMGEAIRLNQKVLQRELTWLDQYNGVSPERDERLASVKGALAGADQQLKNWEETRTKALTTLRKTQTMLDHEEKMLGNEMSKFDVELAEKEHLQKFLLAASTDIKNGVPFQQAVTTNAQLYGVKDGKLLGEGIGYLKTIDDYTRKHVQDEATAHAQAYLHGQIAKSGVQKPTQDQVSKWALEGVKSAQKLYKTPVKPEDVVKGVHTGALVEVNTGTKASEEAAKDFTKSTRATYDQLKNAPMVLRNIEEAKALIPQAKGFMGPGGEGLLEAAKFLNARLGAKINTEGVKGAEELRTRLFFGIMENLKKMDAQPSEMQQIMMRDALGKLGTDPNALASVLDAYGDTIRDKVDLFNQEVAGAEKRGTQFPYDPRITLPPRKAASGEPMIRSDDEFNRLPSGTVFIGPDGQKRKKP